MSTDKEKRDEARIKAIHEELVREAEALYDGEKLSSDKVANLAGEAIADIHRAGAELLKAVHKSQVLLSVFDGGNPMGEALRDAQGMLVGGLVAAIGGLEVSIDTYSHHMDDINTVLAQEHAEQTA